MDNKYILPRPIRLPIFILFFFILHSLFLILLSGCSPVKPWQRSMLMDPAMKIGNDAASEFEKNAESIREGSTSPGGSKTSGGCGCN